ncbi:MAG: DNA polymerase III subunit delta [Cardiobacteriaceae bacterium]|nr:DNA polymerase III subunit delta [Cardiobacteriaceae bacterium]
MNLKPEDAPVHFGRHALPFMTLITGTETLLNLESLDAARARARKDGYDERQRLDTGGAFKWSDLLRESQSLSLFAPRRVIEVHGEEKGLDRKAGETLAALAAQPDDSVRILLHLPHLERAHEKAWYKACFAGGNLAIRSQSLFPDAFIRQIDQRLRHHQVQLTAAARERLIQYCQGNLLAAEQAIARLTLQQTHAPLTEEDLLHLLADAALFSTFSFADAVLRSDWLEAWRIAGKLESEDERQILSLAGLLARDASVLLQLHGGDSDAVFTAFRIGKYQQRHYLQARSRFSPALSRSLVKLAARLDRLAKGVEKGEPWLILRQYLLLRAAAAQGRG